MGKHSTAIVPVPSLQKRSAFREFLYEMNKNKVLYLMCLPGLLKLILFNYIPLGGIWIAFTDYKVTDGIFGSKFVGLRNFKLFFGTGAMAWIVTWNTLVLNFWGIIFGTLMQITIAIFMNEIRNQAFKKITQALMFFPYFLSWVVVGAIVYALFSTDVGVVNRLLKSLGSEPVRWYTETQYWKPILVICNVWKWSGYSSIIYMAAMVNFDTSFYEAAEVDGASKWQQIRYMTIPLLKPTVVMLTLLSIGRIFFGDFGMVYGVVGSNSLLLKATTVIDTYVYQSMLSLGFSYSSAVGLWQSVMSFILILGSNKLAKKVNDGIALF